MIKVCHIVEFLNNLYPTSLASSFDQGKVGLQFGSLNKTVKKVMIALDGTTQVVKEAIENDVDMLILHHPFMFNSMLSFNYDSLVQKKYKLAIQNELNVFAMHTNFDVASDGMNEILAKKLGLKNIKMDSLEVTPDSFLRYGEIDEMPLLNFIEIVKERFNQSHVRYVGDLNQKIKKVGLIGGSGAFSLYRANALSCDAFITGEIKHNNALDAVDLGISLIEVSHAVEILFKDEVKKALEKNFDIEVVLSKCDSDPFNII